MNQTTRDLIKNSAPQLLAGEVRFPAKCQQLAIAIHKHLADHEWHPVSEIAESLGYSQSYILAILGLVREPWGLESSKKRDEGWRSPPKE